MTGRKIFRLYLTLLFLLPSVLPATAQKKELSEARGYLKSRSNYDKAERLMTGLLEKDTANRSNIRIYTTWLEAVVGQYEAANEKLYLKQKYDTAAFYGLIKRMQQVALALDSLDSRPDKKGRVRPEYRKRNAQMLDQLRPNLYYGGTMHVRKGQYSEAFDYFRTYIDAAGQPLFTGYDYMKSDAKMPEAAYWATLCGFRQHDADMTLRYSDLALRDTSKTQFTLQYICEAYRLQSDTTRYVSTLAEGFRRYPEYPYFFPRLADFHTAQGHYDQVLSVADAGLKANPKGQLFLIAKSVALLNLERYDECIAVSRQMVAENDSLPEAYFNLATCYLNQALAVEAENEPRKNRSRLKNLYTEARPYMERYRKLVPADKQRWAPALYRIYLNLNLGKQFEEIDQLMKR